MAMNLGTEVRMIKGVGPQRAELLAQRGIHTLEDLLGYLPFRYEDRIHFSKVKDIQPSGTYTIRARVMSGQATRGEALIHTHFPEPDESHEALNTFRSPAQQRLIFEEFFLYQLSLALDRKATRKENAIAF